MCDRHRVSGVPGEFAFAIDFAPDHDPASDAPWRAASAAAEAWLIEHDYVLASMQSGSPRGIMPAERFYAVAKWRNLTAGQRRDLAGVLLGGDRHRHQATVYLREVPGA